MWRVVKDLAGKKLPDIEVGELRRVGSFGDTNAHVSCRLCVAPATDLLCLHTTQGKRARTC